MKKLSWLMVITLFILVVSNVVFAADTDDAAWIERCVSDNKDEGQTAAILGAYCTCMKHALSTAGTKSLTAWEKTNPTESRDCSKKAGWVGKSD